MRMINYEEEHRKLWSWLADHPEKTKREYFKRRTKEYIPANECFACERAKGGPWVAPNCGKCPLGGPDVVGCFDSDGLFQSWKSARGLPEERTDLARKIAELMWKEEKYHEID